MKNSQDAMMNADTVHLLPHLETLDDAHNHAGELAIYSDSIIFINYASRDIVEYSTMSAISNYFRVQQDTYIFFKYQNAIWTHLNGSRDRQLIEHFMPAFKTNTYKSTCFDITYNALDPILLDESTGEIETFESLFAFTEEVVKYENFKWYRLNIYNCSMKERDRALARMDSFDHVKYNPTNYMATLVSFFFVRNEKTKRWLTIDFKRLRNFKASREYMDSLKMANMLV